MSFFDRFFGRKDSQARVLVSMQQTGQYVPTLKDYGSFAKEGYSKNVVAYRSIAMVSKAIGPIPWVVYSKSKSKNGKPQELDNHPILDLLKRPNPMMAKSAFFEAVTSFRMISGNSYINAVGPGMGNMSKITELWPVRPDRMRIVAGSRGYPLRYVYTVNQQSTNFDVDQVNLKSPILHLKYFNPTDDWYGMSPIEAAALGIDMHNSANKWNVSLMQNSARPSGALVATVSERSSGMLTDEQFQRLKNQIEDQYSGASNAGRPMVLEGGLDWKPFSFSPQQMEWIENKNTSSRDIALAFGVPPMLLGIPGDNTYSNYQEARAALYEETVIPEAESIRDEFNNWLTPAFNEGLELDIDKDQIHALAPRRQAVWDKVSNANFLTINEKRESVGYDPIEEGDVLLVPTTQMALEDLLDGGSDDAQENANDQAEDQGEEPEMPGQSEIEEDDDDEPAKGGKPSIYGKVFNLKNDRARTKEWRGQIRMRKSLEKRLMRQSQAVFEMEAGEVAHVTKGVDARHAEIAAFKEIDHNQVQWKKILTANLNVTAKVFGARLFDSMKSIAGGRESKDSESQFDSYVKDWIELHVGERIKNISETTKERVLKAIRDAEAEAYDSGEGVVDFSKAIADAYDGFSESRAMTIARTETGTTANMALMQAAKATQIPGLQKEWVSAKDNRTREDHVEADGQTVAIDEKFSVGGYEMSQPLDPSGPPEEVINCRCAVIFSRGQSTDEEV